MADTTTDIVDQLNRDAAARSTKAARVAGSILAAGGILGCLAWLWITYRWQDRIEGMSFDVTTGFSTSDGRSASLADRADVFVNTIGVLLAALTALGIGLGLRVLADATDVRLGVDITGYRRGRAALLDEELDDEELGAER